MAGFGEIGEIGEIGGCEFLTEEYSSGGGLGRRLSQPTE